MKRFLQLFQALESSNKTKDKLAALVEYFRSTDAADGAWGVWLLMGNKLSLGISARLLREWTEEKTNYPKWLIDECYERVGDLAETVALLLPESTHQPSIGSLTELIEDHLLPMAPWGDRFQINMMQSVWDVLNREEKFLTHKMITGGFRIGVSKSLLSRALAEAFDIERSIITHRLMGKWNPTPKRFQELKNPNLDSDTRLSQPYPFYLASPVDQPLDDLGKESDWVAEHKWDGIRAQLIKRHGEVYIWSRGEELITDSFPEIRDAAKALSHEGVLDGEILAWKENQPLSFHYLQSRIGRKRITPEILDSVPVKFLAYDCLEFEMEDIRNHTLVFRSEKLLQIIPKDNSIISRSEPISFSKWSDLISIQKRSRELKVEGLMLKSRQSTYQSGRVKGQWWKWKINPLTVDLVLMYAQVGHGRRANIFTDYTLGAWDGNSLVPVAKAYSGLTDKDLKTIDRWIKQNTLAKRGPVRTVPPHHVFEIGFEGIRPSSRHKSGVALRFPRILRWRTDKKPDQADQMDQIKMFAKD